MLAAEKPNAVLPSPPPAGAFALPADRAEQAPAPQPQPATAATAVKKPTLTFAPVSKDVRPTLSPATFIDTLRAAERYHAIAEAGGWGVLPKGAPIKVGDRGEPVMRLKERLAAEGDLDRRALPGEVFDEAVLAAVKRFQARHGLPETGLVGPKTIDAMNVPAAARARQLAASAQRLAGTRFPFGERYVVVNIPSATVEAVEKGEVLRRYVAVVGKKDRASPTLMARITEINFNPNWTVPASIVRKDIIPQMRKDPEHLARMKIRIFDGHGQEVDPKTIDWSTDRAASYTLRQDPGAANSLGQIRIDMPNQHAVYMHDTPSKKLFARNDRFHSSGCVRVGDVKSFVAWLLEGTSEGGPWNEAAIDAAIAAGHRQDVKLVRPVPVAWVYLTGFATPDGEAHFRDDVYGLDAESASIPAGDPLVTSSVTRPMRPAPP